MSQAQQQIANDILGFYADFIGYVHYAFPWGEKGTPLEKFTGPFDWHKRMGSQLEKVIMDNLQRGELGIDLESFQKAVASGHGIGKSACVAWLILFFMSTRKYCRGVVTANTGNQLNDKTWPELAKWHNMAINKDWFEWTATKFVCKLDNGRHSKNWKFDATTWSEENTEAFAGLHNASSTVVLIFDEASAIPPPVWEVAEGALTDGECFWFCFGNPTRNTGRFRECFGKYRNRWATQHVDSREVPITNKKKIAQWIEDYGIDSDFVRKRVRGVFPRGGDKQFIANDIVQEAQNRNVIADIGAPLIMGVDVARYGDDKSVVCFRRGRDARSIPAKKFRNLDNMELAYRVAELLRKYPVQVVNIDAGNGSGVIDRLRELKFKVNEVWFGSTKTLDDEYHNRRAEMWGQLRDWLKGGAIEADQDLFDDLVGPEYGFARNGDAILLEAKEKMKDRGLASPDYGDALALTFAVKVSRLDSPTARRSKRVVIAEGVAYNYGE